MAAKGQFLQRFGRRAGFGVAAVCGLALMTVPVLAQFGGSAAAAAAAVRLVFQPVLGAAPARRSSAPVDFSRAPSPQKARRPADRRQRAGARRLHGRLAGLRLEDALGDTPDLAVVRKNRASSGLIRYDSRNENQDWAQVIREAIAATKPKFIVMMLGLNDRESIRDRVSPLTAPRAAAQKPRRRAAAAPAPADSRRAARSQARCSGRRAAPAEQPAIAAPEPQSKSGTTATTYRVHEFRTDEWAAALHQADRRHDRRAEERRRAGVLGRPAVDPRAEVDQRHAVSQRSLPRPRRKGRHQLHRRVGRLRRRRRPLHRCRAPTSKARPAGCAPATACISPRPARASSRIISSAKSAACMAPGSEPVALPSSEPQAPAVAAKPSGPAARPLAGPVVPLTASVTVGAGVDRRARHRRRVGAEVGDPRAGERRGDRAAGRAQRRFQMAAPRHRAGRRRSGGRHHHGADPGHEAGAANHGRRAERGGSPGRRGQSAPRRTATTSRAAAAAAGSSRTRSQRLLLVFPLTN